MPQRALIVIVIIGLLVAAPLAAMRVARGHRAPAMIARATAIADARRAFLQRPAHVRTWLHRRDGRWIWAVYLIGGDVCLPPHGGLGGACSRWVVVDIDARTGRAIGSGGGGLIPRQAS
jgi:hypothetical protein